MITKPALKMAELLINGLKKNNVIINYGSDDFNKYMNNEKNFMTKISTMNI